MIVFSKLGLGFSCHVSNSQCQMVPFLFSSFSYKADVPRRVHGSEHSNLACDQLHCWLTFVQHSHFVAVMALKNICQHAQVQESTMALPVKCWLFDGKLLFAGELTFTTAWITDSTGNSLCYLISAGLIRSALQSWLLLPCLHCFPGTGVCTWVCAQCLQMQFLCCYDQ